MPGRERSSTPQMPKTAIWLVIIFTVLFILGINTGDLEYLMNLGNTICLSCIGVG
jgi:hypothetical protein